MAEKSEAGLITVGQAARLLMVSEERVRQLCKLGYVERPQRGKVILVSAVQGYIRYLKDEDRRSSKTAADSRVRDARAAEIELRIARQKRALVPREDAEAAMDFLVATVGTEVRGIPARLTREMTLRRKAESLVHEVLTAISDKLESVRDALATGGGELAPGEEDDA